MRIRFVLFALVFGVWAGRVHGQSVRCTDCFAVEKLPPALRAKSETLLLKALDSEALYTIIGGLKPMSSGFASYKISVSKPDLQEIEEARQLLSVWRCGDDLYADVHHFAKTAPDPKTKEEMRFAEAVIFHRAAVRQAVQRHAVFFAPFGLGRYAHPTEILMAIEYSPSGPRWRGLGYLFGFPDYAVDFFVQAGEEQEKTGQFVKREFYSIPTFVAAERRFVWAVPVGHQERDEDRLRKQQAATILTEYKRRRAQYIGTGKPGVVRMLRDWIGNKRGRCTLPYLPLREAQSSPAR